MNLEELYMKSKNNRDLFRRMDKICHSDKPHCTVTSGACGLYWNPMLCERLEGRTGILLIDKKGHVPLFNLVQSILLDIRVPAPLNN